MDTITFEIGDITIQLVNGETMFWKGGTNHEADVVVDIVKLQNVLSASRMLRTAVAEELDRFHNDRAKGLR